MEKLFTCGYTASGADQRLAILMDNPLMTLVDIRYSPASRFRPAFRRAALEQQYGNRYCHIRDLGNVNYRDHSLPIVLANASSGISDVSFWINRGYEVCLLCACSDVTSCHRLVVARLLQEKYSCDVVHL